MRKVREVLRLRFEKHLTYRDIAFSVGVAATTVGDLLNRAKASALSWPIAEDLDDAFLEQLLYSPKGRPQITEPDALNFEYIHQELRKKHVTLQLLWQEYKSAHPNGYQYSQFCSKYRDWNKSVDLVMRQAHAPGERVFVDYAGQTMKIYDAESGKVQCEAQIFIATWGASNYTYAEASYSQDKASWIRSHVNAFNFFGGVPELLIPDNLKSAVTATCRYDPDLNPVYYQMAIHYGCAIIPARKRKPRDKAKVESAVFLVERWILAALRNRRFFSLSELNREIRRLLEKLNHKPFQKLEGCRRSQFEKLDLPVLKALPEEPFQMREAKLARVHIDYHIEIDRHYYSVPYTLARKEVEVRYNDFVVEIYFNNKKIASHRRGHKIGAYTTTREHMPASHRHHASWTPERLTQWARQAGPATALVAEKILESKPHPEVGFKAVLGLISLAKKFGNERLEKASERVLAINSPTYKSVKSTLNSGLDQVRLEKNFPSTPMANHRNIRGREYYQQTLLKEQRDEHAESDR
jgi:transposase